MTGLDGGFSSFGWWTLIGDVGRLFTLVVLLTISLLLSDNRSVFASNSFFKFCTIPAVPVSSTSSFFFIVLLMISLLKFSKYSLCCFTEAHCGVLITELVQSLCEFAIVDTFEADRDREHSCDTSSIEELSGALADSLGMPKSSLETFKFLDGGMSMFSGCLQLIKAVLNASTGASFCERTLLGQSECNDEGSVFLLQLLSSSFCFVLLTVPVIKKGQLMHSNVDKDKSKRI